MSVEITPIQYLSDPTTLHIALATFPQGMKQSEYVEDIGEYFEKAKKSIKENFKTDNRETLDKEFENFYQPQKYYILGGYDIAFVTLVGSYKFAQKLFDNYDSKHNGFQQSFQIITGSTPIISHGFELQKYLSDDVKKKPFLGICNLKLSNAFLIGNGHSFLHEVLSKINKVANKINNLDGKKAKLKYVLLQAYSWFEVTLLVFSDEITQISNFITNLRWLQIHHLENKDTIIANSLYNHINGDKEINDFYCTHIFADSHTYLGVNYDVVNSDLNGIEEYEILYEKIRKQPFESIVEWQIKPGHLVSLSQQINDSINIKDFFDTENPKFITGKTDFYFPFKDETKQLNKNLEILRWLRSLSEKKSFEHFRKIKTRPLFHKLFDINEQLDFEKINDIGFQHALFKLTENPKSQNIDEILKSLKISRALREKILKMFYLYNNGIQDPILFTYFIDFSKFMKFLSKTINSFEDERDVKEIEKKVSKFIAVFDEGFYLRMFNSYFADDLGDSTELDFNSSIQGILTAYSTIVTSLSDIIYLRNNSEEVFFAPIVQINLQNTVADITSINYNVSHLTSPEFFCFTIIKEILNPSFYITEISKLVDDYIKPVFEILSKRNVLIGKMVERGNIDFEYLLIDMYRFVFTCNFDIKLFEYFFWVYNLQNPSLYTRRGSFSPAHFQLELFRLMYLVTAFDKNYLDKMECPLPELQTHWDNIFYIFKRQLTEEDVYNKIKDGFLDIIKIDIAIISNDIAKGKETILSTEQDKTSFESISKNHLKDSKGEIKNLGRLENNFCYYQGFYEKYFPNNEFKGVFYDSKDKNTKQFILALMYSYLNSIYIKNDKKIHFLHRNWDTGKPFKKFNMEYENNEKAFYFIDQLGGVFFNDSQKAQDYFKMRNAMLQSLWHLSLVLKKDFFN